MKALRSTRGRIAALAAILPLFSSPAGAAGVDVILDNPSAGTATIRVWNDITRGDLSRVIDAAKQIRNSGRKLALLELDSWGGDGDTGMELAEYVYRKNLKVVIRFTCLSACSFPAMAALGRGNLFVGSHGEMGVHQVYDIGTGEPNLPWTNMAVSTLSKYGAPRELLKAMLDTSPDGMTRFGSPALQMMGAILE